MRLRAKARRLSRQCQNRALYSGRCFSSARIAFPGFRSYLSSMDFGTTARAASQGARPNERQIMNARKAQAEHNGDTCGVRREHHAARCALCSAQRQLNAAQAQQRAPAEMSSNGLPKPSSAPFKPDGMTAVEVKASWDGRKERASPTRGHARHEDEKPTPRGCGAAELALPTNWRSRAAFAAMGDFMDVPAFDGPGVFARATDSAWVALGQTQARRSLPCCACG